MKKRSPAILTATLLFVLASSAVVHSQPADEQTAPVRDTAEQTETSEREPAPSIDELIRTALKRSPTLEALRHRVKAARLRTDPAAAFPDPMIEITAQGVGVYPPGPNSMVIVEYKQELPYPGKRDARRASARAETDVRAAELAQMKGLLVAQLRSAYAQVYRIDQERRNLDAAKELLTALAKAVTSRYTSGGATREALLKIELEISRVRERQTDLETERASWEAVVNQLLDQPSDTPLGNIAELPDVDVPSDGLEKLAVANSPEVAVKKAQVRAAEMKAEEARLEDKPDFLLGGGAGMDYMKNPVVMVTFGITLPIWSGNKQTPLAESAEAELEAARSELRDAEAAARSDAARLQAQWDNTGEQIIRYREEIIPQRYSTFEAARASYLSDNGDFSLVIEDFTLWLDAKTELERRNASLFTTWAYLDRLITPSDEPSSAEEKP